MSTEVPQYSYFFAAIPNFNRSRRTNCVTDEKYKSQIKVAFTTACSFSYARIAIS
jgi:hypothetical protein